MTGTTSSDTRNNTEPADAARPVGSVDDPAEKPSTMTVIGLLALTSLTFSYLGAYAVAGALVRSDVLKQWPPDADPRPKWLMLGFAVLLSCCLSVGGLVRFLSRRQIQQIDQMSEEAST